jgi:hypothetical protein
VGCRSAREVPRGDEAELAGAEVELLLCYVCRRASLSSFFSLRPAHLMLSFLSGLSAFEGHGSHCDYDLRWCVSFMVVFRKTRY